MKREGNGREEYVSCTSLSMGVLMCSVVASVCCAVLGSMSVCCLTVCGGQLQWWDHIQTVSQMPTHTLIQKYRNAHTQFKQKNEFKGTHKHTHTHTVYTSLPPSSSHMFASLFLSQGLSQRLFKSFFKFFYPEAVTSIFNRIGVQSKPGS